MTGTDRPSNSWSKVRQHLAGWDQAALLALVKDLYEAAGANRDFLHARCQVGEDGGEMLERYRAKVVEPFFPKRGMGKLNLAEARKAIRDYRKATGNIRGTAELLLTYVENGTSFTCEYGDIDERFYNSLESALNELAVLLLGEAQGAYPELRERLATVARMADRVGWGYGDYVGDVVSRLERKFSTG